MTPSGPARGHRDIDDLEAILRPIMRGVASAVGSNCEVVLHDMTADDVGRTIVAIENGQVTGRRVGGPSTNLGLETLRQQAEGTDEFGYRSRTHDGRELRSSSMYLRDPAGRVVAMLCINIDLTPMQAARQALEQLLGDGQEHERQEVFAHDISDVLDSLIESAIAHTGKSVALMDREDKKDALRYLDDKGAFFIKRAVERIARRLKISRGAAYSYLEQIRAAP